MDGSQRLSRSVFSYAAAISPSRYRNVSLNGSPSFGSGCSPLLQRTETKVGCGLGVDDGSGGRGGGAGLVLGFLASFALILWG